jgi:thymidylate synthase
MKNYHDLLQKILDEGIDSQDRTGIGTRSLFAEQLKFDLREGFPAVTTKKLAWGAVKAELLWFIEGSGDERRLAEIQYGTRDASKRTIWTANAQADYWLPKARANGDLGRVYGVQWRDWRSPIFKGAYSYTSTDQLKSLIENIKNDPYSRRHILMAYNPGEIDQMALPPCHMMCQFYVRNGELSCQVYIRSNDMFLGCPFNIASYSLLTHMIAQVCGLSARELILSIGDAHCYHDHIDAVKEQLSRNHKPLPTLWLNPSVDDINNFCMDDCQLVGYESHPTIKASMAV